MRLHRVGGSSSGTIGSGGVTGTQSTPNPAPAGSGSTSGTGTAK